MMTKTVTKLAETVRDLSLLCPDGPSVRDWFQERGISAGELNAIANEMDHDDMDGSSFIMGLQVGMALSEKLRNN